MSMAMVMGPTPPGTGVIARARGSTAGKSTSPQVFPPTSLIPTSITTAPSLTIRPVMNPGFPTADMRRSADRVFPARSLVFEWQTVTVAPALRRRTAMGRPTSIDLPTTTASLPSTGMPYSRKEGHDPEGCTG